MPASQAPGHILRAGEHITHIMEDGESDIVVQIRNADGRKTKFQIVKEERTASNRKSCERIARPRLIQSESAMGAATTHIEAFGQRDQCMADWSGVRRAE